MTEEYLLNPLPFEHHPSSVVRADRLAFVQLVFYVNRGVDVLPHQRSFEIPDAYDYVRITWCDEYLSAETLIEQRRYVGMNRATIPARRHIAFKSDDE
jgi:hypothetical protein